jgi:hypothetical protein
MVKVFNLRSEIVNDRLELKGADEWFEENGE